MTHNGELLGNLKLDNNKRRWLDGRMFLIQLSLGCGDTSRLWEVSKGEAYQVVQGQQQFMTAVTCHKEQNETGKWQLVSLLHHLKKVLDWKFCTRQLIVRRLHGSCVYAKWPVLFIPLTSADRGECLCCASEQSIGHDNDGWLFYLHLDEF